MAQVIHLDIAFYAGKFVLFDGIVEAVDLLHCGRGMTCRDYRNPQELHSLSPQFEPLRSLFRDW